MNQKWCVRIFVDKAAGQTHAPARYWEILAVKVGADAFKALLPFTSAQFLLMSRFQQSFELGRNRVRGLRGAQALPAIYFSWYSTKSCPIAVAGKPSGSATGSD
jgi:hypothetical protein